MSRLHTVPIYKRAGYKEKVKREKENMMADAKVAKSENGLSAPPMGVKRKYRVKFYDSTRGDYFAITERLSEEAVLLEIEKMFAGTYNYEVYLNDKKIFTNRRDLKYSEKLRETRIKCMNTKFIYDNIEHILAVTGLSRDFIFAETRKNSLGIYQFVDENGSPVVVHRKIKG